MTGICSGLDEQTADPGGWGFGSNRAPDVLRATLGSSVMPTGWRFPSPFEESIIIRSYVRITVRKSDFPSPNSFLCVPVSEASCF